MQADAKALLKAAFSDAIVLLGLVSTIATFFPVLGSYRLYLLMLAGVLIVVGVFRGGLKVIAKKTAELQAMETSHAAAIDNLNRQNDASLLRLTQESASLQKRLQSFEHNEDDVRRRLLADLVSELKDNLGTSQAYFTGSPGNRSYVSPSIDFWRTARNQLSEFIDERLFIDLASVYERIQRWKGIVDSHRVNPDIGNSEVDRLAVDVRNALPAIITRVENGAATAAPQ